MSRNVEFGLGDFSINLKDCYKITFVVACLLTFLEKLKAEDKRSTNPTQVSYNLMLLISRIVYMLSLIHILIIRIIRRITATDSFQLRTFLKSYGCQ